MRAMTSPRSRRIKEPIMKFPPLLEGTLLRRYKRFLADVLLPSGETVTVHCPNSGSMSGCSAPGSRVFLSDSRSTTRKCRYTWELLELNGVYVCINTARTNGVVGEALREGSIASLAAYDTIRPEFRYGESRLDFFLSGPPGECLLEVKSVTLEDNGVARFPDAVTTRGRRHLVELERAVREGKRGVMLFLIQRTDCTSFSPAETIDPAYAAALRKAAGSGVEVLAFCSALSPYDMRLAAPARVLL